MGGARYTGDNLDGWVGVWTDREETQKSERRVLNFNTNHKYLLSAHCGTDLELKGT